MAARNELSLKSKVEVIEYAKRNPSQSSRKIAEVFNCGRTQIQGIFKKRDTILSEYEANAPASRKRHRGTEFSDVNEAMYRWYSLARQRNVPVSGPMLQEEARVIAVQMGHHQFKASNGWLESFKKRHNIRQFTISGEAADVSEETVEGWHERVQSFMVGYKAEDVWNEDETGCFYRALPEKTLGEKKKECKGGKKAKERLTIAFFANAAGGKEHPIVIGKAAKPRCFKGIIKDPKKPEGIPYYSNPKAWMNTEVMTDILIVLNKRLVKQGRNILLFIDNVSSHDPALKGRFSNIKIIFLPKNTTSRLQPLDAGIIKNFKVHYRRLLLKHTLAQIDGTDLTASAIVKTINVLTAIRWIKKAWDEVKPQTIINCFRKTGALPQDQRSEEEEDPFAGLDEDDACLEELVSQFDPESTANEYVNADDGLSTCLLFNETCHWREELRSMVCDETPSLSKQIRVDEDSEDEDEIEPERSSITSYDAALRISNDLQLF